MVSRQEFRRPPGVLITLGINPSFLWIISRLVLIEIGNIIEHESISLTIA